MTPCKPMEVTTWAKNAKKPTAANRLVEISTRHPRGTGQKSCGLEGRGNDVKSKEYITAAVHFTPAAPADRYRPDRHPPGIAPPTSVRPSLARPAPLTGPTRPPPVCNHWNRHHGPRPSGSARRPSTRWASARPAPARSGGTAPARQPPRPSPARPDRPVPARPVASLSVHPAPAGPAPVRPTGTAPTFARIDVCFPRITPSDPGPPVRSHASARPTHPPVSSHVAFPTPAQPAHSVPVASGPWPSQGFPLRSRPARPTK